MSGNRQFVISRTLTGLIKQPVNVLDTPKLTTQALKVSETPNEGYVLTSDANGIGSWEPPTDIVAPILISGNVENSTYGPDTLIRSGSSDGDGPGTAGTYIGSYIELSERYVILFLEIDAVFFSNPLTGITGLLLTIDTSQLPDSSFTTNVTDVFTGIDYGNINIVSNGDINLGSVQKAYGTSEPFPPLFSVQYGQPKSPATLGDNLDGNIRKFVFHIVDTS